MLVKPFFVFTWSFTAFKSSCRHYSSRTFSKCGQNLCFPILMNCMHTAQHVITHVMLFVMCLLNFFIYTTLDSLIAFTIWTAYLSWMSWNYTLTDSCIERSAYVSYKKCLDLWNKRGRISSTLLTMKISYYNKTTLSIIIKLPICKNQC